MRKGGWICRLVKEVEEDDNKKMIIKKRNKRSMEGAGGE